MYYNQYRNNEPVDESQDTNLREEESNLETLNDYEIMPEYEDNSVVEDGFRSAEDFRIEDNDEFIEFIPPYSCPFYRYPHPGGGNMPPTPPFGTPGGNPGGHPSGHPGGPSGPGGSGGSHGQVPSGPPPSFAPSKSQSSYHGGVGVKVVEPGSLRPCIYKYVYMWVKNGGSFWTYLTYVGRTSASGYRWNGYRWVYFGIDLRRIESFICY